MDQENFIAFSNLAVLALALVSIPITLGVVWRVEKKLDLTFKLFLMAVIFFLLSEIAGIFSDTLYNGKEYLSPIFEAIFNLMFVLFFLAGMLEARSMVKSVEKELEKEAKKKAEKEKL